MEFVLVTFPTLRAVRMDGAQQGQTGQIIGVQRGTHLFDLGIPQDYAPPRVQAVVANTTQMQPLVIPFQPAALLVPAGRRAKKAAGRKKGAGRKKAPARKKPARKQASRKRAKKATRPGAGRSKKATRGATRRR